MKGVYIFIYINIKKMRHACIIRLYLLTFLSKPMGELKGEIGVV